MQTTDDVKRLQDQIDNISSWSEKAGTKLNDLLRFLGRKVVLAVMFLFFGILVGFVGNFFKALFIGRNQVTK